MPQIRILPEIVANKIAAGEVVERPASVVKELVENALDAQSTRIAINIDGGGRALIEVADNGNGMGHDDALLALERFATSKIHDDHDLFSIRTLGFRGEALPSIAAVSKMNLVTRDARSESGVAVRIHGGKILDVTETGAPVGTVIGASHLFYNTPARRKFLKTIPTEMGHIADVTAAMALGRPGVHFKLVHNGKSVKNWPAVSDPALRVAAVLGQVESESLIPVSAASGDVALSGHLGPSRLARSTGRGIYLYVNGRRVHDRMIQHALFDGYGGRLMKGQFPLAVLFLELPFDQVDVNVHPTKHEIRLADQRGVHNFVRDHVARSITEAERRLWAVSAPAAGAVEEEAAVAEAPIPYRITPNKGAAPRSDDKEPFVYRRAESPGRDTPMPAGAPPASPDRIDAQPPETMSLPVMAAADEQQPLWRASGFGDLEVIGQCHGTYILCQGPDGLIVIDQHAAHERIVYEQLKARQGRVESQRLLMPDTVELGFVEAQALEALIESLDRLGLELEPFGGNTFVVKSVPVMLDDRNVAGIVTELAEKAADIGMASGLEKLLDACRMVMACHHAIRANQRLTVDQIRHMLTQLDRCEDPSHCPHGRPTWIQWTVKDLEKAFKRIVS